ncbi:hypothetical protein [Liquorilactobacillus uvarum]|uniref:Uncharacterized protein n=1 Tax=Liquorilactobacillus uvarum DSM 19971 TaxID=1423812 RepID=A0A0R1Q0V7_9LACO|nr:hypothetical protein [Liquorilactobacillus uvarum]KRL38358.1 hypothetical protein FD20_GL001979 [Liquorilactobacillus uvarum DSM 19971]
MEFNKNQVEATIVQRLNELLNRKIEHDELSSEAYVLYKDEMLQVPTISGKPLPEKVMAYFYGCENYIGFLITDLQQQELLAWGILDSNNQLVRGGKNE